MKKQPTDVLTISDLLRDQFVGIRTESWVVLLMDAREDSQATVAVNLTTLLGKGLKVLRLAVAHYLHPSERMKKMIRYNIEKVTGVLVRVFANLRNGAALAKVLFKKI